MNGINLFGVGGIIAALIGLVLYGRSLGKKSMEGKLAKAEREKEKASIQKEVAQKTSQATVDSAKAQAEAKAYYESHAKAIDDSVRVGDEDTARRIAAETAKKAIEKGASVKE